MTDLTIAVLAGTTREQRKSIHAAKLVAEVGATFDGIEIIFVVISLVCQEPRASYRTVFY